MVWVAEGVPVVGKGFHHGDTEDKEDREDTMALRAENILCVLRVSVVNILRCRSQTAGRLN